MTRPRRTNEELRKARIHISYELRALDAAFRLMLKPGVQHTFEESRLLLEAFLIHVRTLVDFFYVDSTNKDDMIAQDFLPSSTDWAAKRPTFPVNLKELRTAINKLLAHLSYSRRKYAEEEWQWKIILRSHLLETAKTFKDCLPDELWEGWEVPEPVDPWAP